MTIKTWEHRAERLMVLKKIHLTSLKKMYTKIRAEFIMRHTQQGQAGGRKGKILRGKLISVLLILQKVSKPSSNSREKTHAKLAMGIDANLELRQQDA